MKIISKFLLENSSTTSVPFVVHQHNPRSGSEHYDLRILDPKNDKLLHSFAAGTDFEEKIQSKIVLVKTRDHDPRWLDLQNYRLSTYDKGECIIHKAFSKYWEIEFKGKKIKGTYKLFRIKSKRGDNWLLVKSS